MSSMDPNMLKEAGGIVTAISGMDTAAQLMGQPGVTAPKTAPTQEPGLTSGGFFDSAPTINAGDYQPQTRFQKIASGLGDFSEDFFGSIDNTIQSPAKLLGIGLLNQMGGDRRYGTMGLLAKGAFDAFGGLRDRRRMRRGLVDEVPDGGGERDYATMNTFGL